MDVGGIMEQRVLMKDLKKYINSIEKLNNSRIMDNKELAKFIGWCNTPVYQTTGDLVPLRRVIAQLPDYQEYSIIDKEGEIIEYNDKMFLSSEELVEYYLNTQIDGIQRK